MTIHRPIALTVFVGATLLHAYAALAQFTQQGPKLVGNDYVGQPLQGTSVSLSADGNTALIGGSHDRPQSNTGGAVWVWTRSAGVWTQQGPKLASAGSGGQGFSVSLSADGNTALVGAPFTGTAGAALVWTRSGGIWTQQGPTLVGSGSIGGSVQGWSVALSADGNTAIVGGINDNGNTGAAWIFVRSGGVWTQQGSKLVGSGAVGQASQGAFVALSADGNTALIGGGFDNGGIGAAWVWTRTAGLWTQQGNKLVASDAVGSALQGASVALSADGNNAMIGGYQDNNNVGAAWVWARSGGVWSQQGTKLVASSGVFGKAQQGSSVSLSSDGNTAVVGGPLNNSGIGAAWIWTRETGVWTERGRAFGVDFVDGPAEGAAVSVSGDGKTALVGGPVDHQLVGAAWVFPIVASDLSIVKTLNGGPLAAAGGNLNYTITVLNTGLGTATGIVVTDILPAGTTFVSATPSLGSCTGTATVSCALPVLATGATATINLVVKSSSSPGTVTNTATVTAKQVDANPANNSSTLTITTVDPFLVPAASAWSLIALLGMLALLGVLANRS
ncbi:MAG TPA: DUF11 domain-containing protein [Thermoanaerobaculia bacterium]|jgi:uncharacterized repeat protein (TIGR01451 family)|nr:DUF11 domain-containing protein [Thermoanaerobaculia bacterium]